MKKLSIAAALLVSSVFCFGQPEKFIGIWEGDLDAGVQKLRMVFTFKKTNNGIHTVTIQAPEQSPLHIPADTLIFTSASDISLEKKQFKMSFTGKLVNDSTIVGTFVQGMSIPLILKKVEKPHSVQAPRRPQTPKTPFPYKSVNVSFPNKQAGIQLAGTLTLPDTSKGKRYPGIILISGSGAQDRDETIAGHKPFAVIADHLTRQGFAVLRYDDRGTDASTGDHSTATSADFAEDVKAAVAFLQSNPNIDSRSIGLIGHSEGGMIAPMVANSLKEIKFIVLLAGPGIHCLDLLTEQNVAIFKSRGIEPAAAEAYGPMFKKLTNKIIKAKDSAKAFSNAIEVLENWKPTDEVRAAFNLKTGEEKKAYAKGMVGEIYNPWFRYFLAYDPAPLLQKLSCDVLALNGGEDIQVLPASNLAGIKNSLQKSKSNRFEVKEIPKLNHLFQTCDRCGLDEYAKLEETFSPLALQIMSEWLKKYIQ